jgi:hypothetical protein
MNKKNIGIIGGISLLIGMLFFGWHNELIIFRSPFNRIIHAIPDQSTTKKIVLSYWHNNQWHTEENKIIWSDDPMHNVTYLVNNWLSLITEIHNLSPQIKLQSALIGISGYDLYLSFDTNPLPMSWSIHAKLMFIEGLLKSLRTNDIPLQTVQLLINHKPLIDAHLDFSQPWPVSGFVDG